MRPAGQAEIDAAKADGRWDAAYAPASNIEVPPDLAEATGGRGRTDVFAALESQNRYAILFSLHDAKRPETRARGGIVEAHRAASTTSSRARSRLSAQVVVVPARVRRAGD